MDTAEQSIRLFNQHLDLIHRQISAVIIGQEHVISEVLIALLAGGHILLEGLPGLGKTQLIKALAGTIDVNLSRIQCTSDLMPSDITGSEILLHQQTTQKNAFEFRPGPIFSNLVLVDEINRASPKTQSALLEAMQEQQITCAGTSYPLPAPFWIIATQNPIELEGTYPLPEAQLDRFLYQINIDYPNSESLFKLLDTSLDSDPVSQLHACVDKQQLAHMTALSQQVIVSDSIKHAAVSLIMATHGNHTQSKTFVTQHIRFGASPRGLQAMIKTARIKALTEGRAHVDISDIASSALPALRHRILLNIESELEGNTPDTVLAEIINLWKQSQNKPFYHD